MRRAAFACAVTLLLLEAAARGSPAIWIPPVATTWQWQLSGVVDQTVDVSMYDIDLFDNSAAVVDALHADGRRVVCYLSAGTW